MSANPQKGEVELVIEGVTYVLVASFNGLIALQTYHAVDGVKPRIEDIMQRIEKRDLDAIRSLFWCLFERHHPEVTIEQAGRLIDAVGGTSRLDELLTQAMTQSHPDPVDVEAVERLSARPPKAAPAKRRRGGIGARLN